MKINAMACQHGMARKARQAYNWLSSIRMFRESGDSIARFATNSWTARSSRANRRPERWARSGRGSIIRNARTVPWDTEHRPNSRRLARGMCLSKKTRPIPRLLNKRTGDSHYHWTKKWGAGQICCHSSACSHASWLLSPMVWQYARFASWQTFAIVSAFMMTPSLSRASSPVQTQTIAHCNNSQSIYVI